MGDAGSDNSADHDRPYVPDHAAEQWIRRGGYTNDSPAWVTIQVAWARAEPVAPHQHGFDADEVRLDGREDMLLLRCGGTIKTCIDAVTARSRGKLTTADAAESAPTTDTDQTTPHTP